VPIKGKIDFNKLGHSSQDGLNKKGLNTTTGSIVDTQYSGYTDERETKNRSSMNKSKASKASKQGSKKSL